MKDVRTSGNDGRHIEGAPSNKVDMCAEIADERNRLQASMTDLRDARIAEMKTLAAELRAASENKALAIGEAWELLERAADALDPLASFARGDAVEKIAGKYGGPGIVDSITADGNVVVAHQIAGGWGKMLHIYSPSQIRHAADGGSSGGGMST